jgi:serine/threonine-protein kinase
VLEPGEWIENLEIVRVVLIGHNATIYQARRNNLFVTLKVAHPGERFKQHLKDEAQFLRSQRKDRLVYLPLLLDPYTKDAQKKPAAPSEEDWSYGRASVHDTLLYFLVFEHIDGEPLRDLLSKRPQLWSYHAGWVTQSIAIALQELHQMQLLHLAISPESALVTFDDDDIPRLVLIDFGTLLSHGTALSPESYRLAHTPYAAPDLHLSSAPHPQADVYSLAVLFAQMLLGYLPPSAPVTIPSMTDVSAIINRALIQKTTSVAVFTAELKQLFGAVPVPRTNRWLGGATTLSVTIALLGTTFFALVILTLYNAFML